MSRPPYMHSNFFSSLKQVERRLKLEYSSSSGNQSSSPIPRPRLPVQLSSLLPVEEGNVESLVSSALYIHTTNDQTRSCTAKGSEKPPVEFLSMSNEFPSAQNEPPPQHSHINQSEEVDLLDGNNQNVVDDVQLLLNMLHLSTFEVDEGQGKGTTDVGEEGWCRLSKGEKQNEDIVDLENGASDGECCDKLSGKFVRLKGPICQKEAWRLEGWIKHFLNGGKDVLEPFRLAHLLLGKAALAVGDEEDGLDELLVFPSTIDEYLHNDPSTSSRIHA